MKISYFDSDFTKFIPECPIDNKRALVQVMAWCQTGIQPLSEPMVMKFSDCLNELILLLIMITTMVADCLKPTRHLVT